MCGIRLYSQVCVPNFLRLVCAYLEHFNAYVVLFKTLFSFLVCIYRYKTACVTLLYNIFLGLEHVLRHSFSTCFVLFLIQTLVV